jgi:hypothetical protein
LAWLICWAAADAAPLFEDDTVLDIELRGPLRETLRDTQDRAERPFILTVDGVELEVMVRIRGKSRVETCRFPPLRLSFVNPAETVFAGQGKLKLVTHCSRSASHEINVLEEFAAYRLVGLLVPSAVRVRLLRVRYVDSEKPGKKPLERIAFLLEPNEHIAERIGGQLAKPRGVVLDRLQRQQIASVFIAQYLIGNTDYSLVMARDDDACCHNGILVEVQNEVHYVPYDFDRANLVDPSYARSSISDGRRSRARRYAGYCMDGLDLEAAIRRASDAREQIYSEMAAIERLSGRELRHATHFLGGFFREAEDPARLIARFEKQCVGR